MALILSKKTAVGSLLGKQISPKHSNVHDVNEDDIFKLPALPQRDDESESEYVLYNFNNHPKYYLCRLSSG